MMSLWDALRMNMMISYQELVRTFLSVKGKGTTSRDVYISEMRVLRPNTIVTMLILLVNVASQLVSKSIKI